MSAIFEMTINSEILSTEELAQMTGCARKIDQIAWLSKNGWIYHKNKAGEAIVGRLYTRLKLSGINPASLTGSGWTPDFSALQ